MKNNNFKLYAIGTRQETSPWPRVRIAMDRMLGPDDLQTSIEMRLPFYNSHANLHPSLWYTPRHRGKSQPVGNAIGKDYPLS